MSVLDFPYFAKISCFFSASKYSAISQKILLLIKLPVNGQRFTKSDRKFKHFFSLYKRLGENCYTSSFTTFLVVLSTYLFPN